MYFLLSSAAGDPEGPPLHHNSTPAPALREGSALWQVVDVSKCDGGCTERQARAGAEQQHFIATCDVSGMHRLGQGKRNGGGNGIATFREVPDNLLVTKTEAGCQHFYGVTAGLVWYDSINL